MSTTYQFRPWGELTWTLGLSAPRNWRLLGCVAAEERSVAALLALHQMQALERVEMLRILDPEPTDAAAEESFIRQRLDACAVAGVQCQPDTTTLDAPLQNPAWRKRLAFPQNTSLCLDISSLPKRFFFPIIKAALLSPNVCDFLILYTKPRNYPDGPLASNPRDWATLTGFGCEDPDNQIAAAARLIVGAGFAVDGLHDHLEGQGSRMEVDVLIPFPAEPWTSVRRSWESARTIEEALGADPDNELAEVKPIHHRMGALDTSTAFDRLRILTQNGTSHAALAPLGPKPLSVAMCLLATQSDRFPVYYAQPRTYALDYSTGCETTYAYWIKHQGNNYYKI
ncbi:MAG: hypothetical protein ACNA8L_03600 [Luteolibacter sp.]